METAVSATPFANESPVDGQPLSVVEATPPSEVVNLVARARAAQVAWAERTVEERVRILSPVRDRVLDRAEAIAREVHRETGKPEVEALVGEVLPTADVVDYWSRSIEEFLGAIELELDGAAYPKKSGWTFRQPRGTIGLITPWSYPVALPLRTLIPALLAGNSVVWKPSEVAPRSARMVADLFVGLLPEGVLEVAQGGGDVGDAISRADMDLVVFVGSVGAGRSVAHACAERVSPCSLQLGGKDAAIVLADANLDRAANGVVWGALTNAGQNCASIERVYVVKSVAEAFIERVAAEVKALRPGDEIGPITTEKQRALVAEQLAAEEAAGGKMLTGARSDERQLAPIVLRVESDASPLMQHETFGPIIPIAVVEDVDEAIRRANASRYGLTASLWTRNLRNAERLAHRLRAGVVTINNHAFTGALPGAPWGGHGDSGYGVTSSAFALDALTRPRFVLTDRSRSSREMWWYPYTPALRQIALSMAILRSGTSGVFRKLGAFFRLLSGFLARFRR
jgi:acyl-CoA reductase-like NAD-dependent aldehyde dehydrogenase